jgi:hypothetical protein
MLGLILQALLLGGLAQGAPEPPAARPVVIVELFTSEGCSSCPPADAALARLAREQPVAGTLVVALSEHVDYWDRLGWKDPFSSRRFSDRQRRYAAVLGGDRLYTPQMIVDGRDEVAGSDEAEARRSISRAARDRKVRVRLAAGPQNEDEDGLPIDVVVERDAVSGGAADVLLAVCEDNLTSEVRRGENRGRTLSHAAVVRRLETLGRLDSPPGARFAARPVVALDPSWKRRDLRAVVIVQARTSLKMLGAGTLDLSGGTHP